MKENIDLIDYIELSPSLGTKRMVDYFEEKPYEYQEEIADYLYHGNVFAACPGFVKDRITNQYTSIPMRFMTDGKYDWCTDLGYYVEKYNLRMPKDFEDYVISKIKEGD